MAGGGGGRLFEAGHLLTFSAFRMGAYSRWALIRGWTLIRINTVTVLDKICPKQYRSQLSRQCREGNSGYRCIYYISSHLCGKNVLAVVHTGDCMSLTDCVLYHNNTNVIH